MNEPEFRLEEALRLKEKHGGEVVALSMGPDRVKQDIKEALQRADRGIHVGTKVFRADPLGSRARSRGNPKGKGRSGFDRSPE